MNAKELRQLSLDVLKSRADEIRSQVAKLMFSQYQRKEKNVKKLRILRHDLARVLTILGERETTHSPRLDRGSGGNPEKTQHLSQP